MSPGFPILLSPQLVLKAIIDVAEPKDLVTLSMCSKRMMRLIKFHWNKKKKWELMVVQRGQGTYLGYRSESVNLLALVDYSNLTMTEKAEYVEIMGHRVLASFGDYCIKTYWMDEQIGTREVIDYICDLFTKDVQSLALERPRVWFIDFIKNRQTRPLISLFVGEHVTLNEEETERVLGVDTKGIDVYAKVPENFSFNGNLPKCDWFYFRHGDWITLDHLINSEISELLVWRSRLTENDFNKLLKHLAAGGCPQLKFLSVEIDHLDIQNLFVDIQDKVVEVTERRTFITPSHREYTFNKSFDIRNKGGTVSSICWYWLSTLIVAVRPGDSQIG